MKKTVFIVGAGASKDFGMPLGIELAADIRSVLQSEIGKPVSSNESIIGSALQSNLTGDFGAAARDLCGGLVSAHSIDRLLDSRKDRPHVVELGKCAIAEAIARKERQSPIGVRADDGQWSSLQSALVDANESWLARLFGLLNEGIPPAEAERVFKSCSFITFNYDRCIERYLQLAFQQSMNRTAEDAAALVNTIPIVHVYGSLGQFSDSNGFGVAFGPPSFQIREAAASIKTFTEVVPTETLGCIGELIARAELIVFLGFAFDPLNVDVLFRNQKPIRHQIAGTCIGLGDSILTRAQANMFARKPTSVEMPKSRDRFISQSWKEPGKLKRLLSPMFCNDFINDDRFKDLLLS